MAFIKVKNNQKYLKAVIFGDAGTGKTTFAQSVAIGLCQESENKKVIILDTEGGIDFFAEHLGEHDIECFVSSDSNMLKDFDSFATEFKNAIAERPHVIIIDSLSYAGGLCEIKYYKNDYYREVKKQWGEKIANPLKMANCHIIVLCRETSELKIVNSKPTQNDDIKAKSCFGIDYELNLLINMERLRGEGKQERVAHVLKDRSFAIDGMSFVNPTFNHIKPHLQGLAKDSEVYLTLKSKIEACKDEGCLEMLKSELSEIKPKLSQTEIGELATIFKNKQKEFIK